MSLFRFTLCKKQNVFIQWAEIYALLLMNVPLANNCEHTVTITDQIQSTKIQSPGFKEGKNYPLNVHCRWNISTSIAKARLSLKFSSFDVETHHLCKWDYVLIYDGVCGNKNENKQRYCGTVLPNTFVSKVNTICLELDSDQYVRKSGFEAVVKILPGEELEHTSIADITQLPTLTSSFESSIEEGVSTHSISSTITEHDVMTSSTKPSHMYTTISIIPSAGSIIDKSISQSESKSVHIPTLYIQYKNANVETFEMCAILTQQSSGAEGFINSPNYGTGNKYPIEANCTIRLISDLGTHFEVSFVDFDVEFHPTCFWDKLTLYDGSDTNSPVLNTLCGNIQHETMISTGSEITMQFISDKYVTRRGFNIKYLVKVDQPNLEPTPTFKSSHMVMSTYGSLNQIENTEDISLTSVDIETTSIIPPTPDVLVPIINPAILTTPPPSLSMMPTILLEQNEQSKETFEICTTSGSLSTGAEGYITSPGYVKGSHYGLNLICTLRLTAKSEKRIKVTFMAFDVEYHPSCKYDNVSIYDGAETTSQLLKTFCGYMLPGAVESSGVSIVIKFVSDHLAPRKGFKLKFEIVDESKTTNPNLPPIERLKEDDVTTSDAHPSENDEQGHKTSYQLDSSSYMNSVTSTPLMESSISLLSTNTKTQSSTNLNVLSSISFNSAGQIGEEKPEISTMSQIVSEFEHTSSVSISSSITSSMTYPESSQLVQPDTKTIFMCSDITSIQIDGQLEIFSPNYGPGQLYPLKVQCHLKILATKGRSIHIEIMDFQLEYHKQCKFDRLVIYDGSDVSSEILHNLCGLKQKQTYTTSGPVVYLSFVSDFIISKRGFHLRVRTETNKDLSTIYTSIEHKATYSKIATLEPSYSSSSVPNPETFQSELASYVDITSNIDLKNRISTETIISTTSVPPSPIMATPSLSVSTMDTYTYSSRMHSSEIVTFDSTKSTQLTYTSNQITSSTDASTKSMQTTDLSTKSTSSTVTSSKFKPSTGTSTQSTITSSNEQLPVECTGVVRTYYSTSGIVMSPGFDSGGMYPRDVTCNWIIVGEKYQNIKLLFKEFALEWHDQCLWDKLILYDGNSKSSPQIGVFCGNKLPDPITSTGGALYIQLETDRMVEKRGFKANYTIKNTVVPKCNLGQTACNGGSCIQEEWTCDGEEDCSDGEDEKSCGLCKDDQLRCGNGECVPNILHCNGNDDCSDGLDEMSCLSVNENDTLQIMHGNVWYPVCADNWPDELGNKICHHLLHGDAEKIIEVTSESLITMALKDYNELSKLSKLHKLFLPSSECTSRKEIHLKCRKKVCGERSLSLVQPYIIGGSRSYPGKWPWVVGIQAGSNFVCGGSLISDQWIVTASHCIESISASPHKARVLVGSVSRNAPLEYHYRVTEIIMHPENLHIHNADIALMRLQRPIKISEYVRPICIHPATLDIIPNTAVCYVAGWGVTKMSDYYTTVLPAYLHDVKMRLVLQSKCKQVYNNRVKDTMLCAGYQYGQIDTCKGDSGSPLMCKIGQAKWVLVGVTSWGETPCGQAGKPGVYTRVKSYMDWINTVTIQEEPSQTCTFESHGLCGYHDESNGSFMWTRRNGGWNRPASDYTHKTTKGHYMYAESSGEKGQRAVLKLPNITQTGHKCLAFSYSFYGEPDAELKIEGANGSHSHDETSLLLMKISYVSGEWKTINVTLKQEIKIVKFIGILLGTRQCGIAVDDVRMEAGECSGNERYRCSFDENTICKYQQLKDEYHDWELKASNTSGYHIQFDGHGKQVGVRAKLSSPILSSWIPRCLEFTFRICSKGSGKIIIHNAAEFGGNLIYTMLLWSSATFQGESCSAWNKASVNLIVASYPHKIVIEAVRGSIAGVIEIDDFNIYNGNCL